MEYGCVGERLGHSFSKELHGRIGEYSYELCEVERENLQQFVLGKQFKGINVTVPYKTDVLPFLDEIDDRAREIGAVNTVVNRQGRLFGYNTDFDGLKALIEKTGLNLQGKTVLILGTGGTSKTARAVVQSLGAAKIVKVGRTAREGNITYEEAYRRCANAQAIVNTTPSGMYPKTDGIPIDIERFPKLEGVVDVVYNPLRTKLVQAAQNRGLKASGGLYMLVAQAVYASEKFFQKPCDVSKIGSIYADILREKTNIVLTGMPGSGKSTLGARLAERLNKCFIDTDALIYEKYGKKPSEIIRTQGTDLFRDLESGVIREVSAKNNCVIATGGGAVLRKENVEQLKLNGLVMFIDRPIESIVPTADRPLSSNREKLQKLYAERYDIYKKTCDASVLNASDEPSAVARIAEQFERSTQ